MVSLVIQIALQKADGTKTDGTKARGTKSYPDLFQKAARGKPCLQIKVGSYQILFGRGEIQQICGVTDYGCLRFSSRPFRDQNEWKPRIQRAEIAKVISVTSFISYERPVCIELYTDPKL